MAGASTEAPSRAARVAVPPEVTEEESAPDLGLYQVLRPDGSAREVSDPAITPAIALRAYRCMKLMRLLDARMVLMQRQGRIGFYGTATGQEAVPVGAALALEPEDWVFQALRESSMMLVRGLPLSTYLAQIFGNAGDLLKGRMQPSHMAARQVNQVSWSSCIGTQLPQAVGAAWAAKLRGDPVVAIGFVGDGGTSEPDFHNAMNFAGVYRVPCVLICQNNHFAISVRPWHQTASTTYAIKGRAYGVPSLRIDGNDVLGVYHAVRQAADRARRGEGPTFLEAVTYRLGAHSTSDDPSRYRSQEEVDAWLERDPVQALRRHLVHGGLIDDERDRQLEQELNGEIAAAVAEAEAHGPPARDTVFDDVYAELPWHLREQREELLALPEAPKHGGGR
jgi:pyruvate dehydrogenase E1 component alpha subunit/2-oxoisovalerate dehydrogenase E1 component alpha subunit